MLKSIAYKKYIGYDEKTAKYSYLYELEDTELSGKFEVVGCGAAHPVAAVIKFYSEKEPDNIPTNLLILFRKYHSDYGWNSIDRYYIWCKKYIPEIKPYQDEIEKLLLLQ